MIGDDDDTHDAPDRKVIFHNYERNFEIDNYESVFNLTRYELNF